MELRIKPGNINQHPQQGVLIRGRSLTYWIAQLQSLGLPLSAIKVYPIPDNTPNSIWGCLVVSPEAPQLSDIGPHERCQCVANLLFIPEKAVLYPQVTAAELDQLLHTKPHILHPAFGLVPLEEEVNWLSCITKPTLATVEMHLPAPPVFVPSTIKSFQRQSVPPEEVLTDLETNVFPQQQKLENRPLSWPEKGKLWGYRALFGKASQASQPPSRLLSWLAPIIRGLSSQDHWQKNWQEDHQQLEKRNQKQIDRLLSLLKDNLSEALKYAIPLDEEGTSRGTHSRRLNLSQRWFNFSLFDKASSPPAKSGTTVLPDEYLNQLRRQYEATAQALISRGEFHQAAFAYLKLLKAPLKAAGTLEQGQLYQEAAAVYQQYLNNREKAAECYEKGHMIPQAIELYQALGRHEKVGDLYQAIHQTQKAQVHYQKVADHYIAQHQYVQVAVLYRNKMNDEATAQEWLLTGWRTGHDAYRCLDYYLSNIKEAKLVGAAIQTLYAQEVDQHNSERFLEVLKPAYRKHTALEEPIRNIAYEIVASRLPTNPAIVSELRSFHKSDPQLFKDTLRYKLNRKSN